MDYLGSFDLPGQDPEERQGYINFSMDRFLKTYDFIPEGIDAKSDILELGGSPYFMSLLIRKNLGVQPECANFFGDGWNGKK